MRCLLCRFSSGQIDEQLVCFDDVCLFFSLLFSFGCLLVCVVFYLHCIFPSFCKNSAAFHLPFPDHQGAFSLKPLPSLNHHFRCILLPRPSPPLSPLYYLDNLVLIQNFDTGTAGGAGDKYEVWLNHHFRCTPAPRPSPPPTCLPCPATFNCSSIQSSTK